MLRSEALYNPLVTEIVAELRPVVDETEPGLRLTRKSTEP